MILRAVSRPVCRALLLLAVLSLAACSTKPKTPTEVFSTRNQAAEYQKLGDGFFSRGKYDEAISFYDEAIQAYSSVDELEGVALARASMGRVYLAAGRLEAAERELGRAFEYAQALGASLPASLAAAGLGEASFRRGEHEAALRRFEEAIALAGEDAGALAVALHDAAAAKAALGRAEEAKADLARASEMNLKSKRWTEYAANRYLLASMLAREGDAAGGFAAAQEALAADKKAENSRGIAQDLGALGKLAQTLGRTEEAYWYWRRSYDTALAIGDAAAVRRALGELRDLAIALSRGGDEPDWVKLLGLLDAAEAGTEGDAASGN